MCYFKIKVCGIRDLFTLNYLKKIEIDAFGCIINIDDSPRNLTITQAKSLFRSRGNLKAVAVTTSTDIEEIKNINATLEPDIIQIHSKIHPTFLKKLSTAVESIIMPVISINREQFVSYNDILKELNEISKYSRIFIIDAATNTKIGGTGEKIDIEFVEKIRSDFSNHYFVLAGGLNPMNVKETIMRGKPNAVDVSSGVESKPGVKNINKIYCFATRAKSAFQFIEKSN